MTRDGAATTVDPFLSEESYGKCMVYGLLVSSQSHCLSGDSISS